MNSKKAVFLGGRQIGVNTLNVLLNNGIRPQLVVGNMDDDGIDKSWQQSLVKVAEEAGLTTIKQRKVKEPEIIAQIKALNPEVIFCIGGTQIIPKEILDIPTIGTVNIHPALLPKYRGRFSTVHALFNGEKYTGVTLHYMDVGMDSGPIVFQEQFPIEESDTGRSVWDKFTEVGTKLFQQYVELWKEGKEIVATPQDESQATTYPKGLPNDGKIDWSWDGPKINRFIRAMTFEPFPPADFMIGDKKMIIIDEKYFKGFE